MGTKSKDPGSFDQIHFSAGVCTEDEGKIYPLLVNRAHVDRFGYGTNIINPEAPESLVKNAKDMDVLHQMLEDSFTKNDFVVRTKKADPRCGIGMDVTVLIDYLFSINNQKVYFFEVVEVK